MDKLLYIKVVFHLEVAKYRATCPKYVNKRPVRYLDDYTGQSYTKWEDKS